MVNIINKLKLKMAKINLKFNQDETKKNLKLSSEQTKITSKLRKNLKSGKGLTSADKRRLKNKIERSFFNRRQFEISAAFHKDAISEFQMKIKKLNK